MKAHHGCQGPYGWRGVLVAVSLVAFGCTFSEPVEPDTLTRVGLQLPDSPLVSIRVAFQTGSIDDPEGKNGLNALTALMIGRGGTQTMTFEELTATLYPWAASIRTQPDKEVTTVIGQVHRDHLEPFYEIFRELILAPRFAQSDFERNRKFLANGIASTLRGNDDENSGNRHSVS